MSAFLADSCGGTADGSQSFEECGDGSVLFAPEEKSSEAAASDAMSG